MVAYCEAVGRCAVTALLYEVSATPKPGLVDRLNQGAHKDMDFFSFMASTAALSSYFIKCAFQGTMFDGDDLGRLFQSLRPLGKEAEDAMLRATGGANTHKGLIFSMGIICAAAGRCLKGKKDACLDAEEICTLVSCMTRGLCARELYALKKAAGFTHGERIYQKYGFRGIRGEVENGFPTVRTYSLPVLRQLKSRKDYPINDILVQTLLHLMAVNEDTNVAARHDKETLNYVKRYASEALDAGGMFTAEGIDLIHAMDRDFIIKNISPGGTADLLAVTIMFDLLQGTRLI
ncbi:triphosphoribosyl-dephospho-CoA synthase CitG [Candidatus Formimonas warabiya]|uniref:Probable 2-(5''-triphosphoribosyl)-3'-dephosphocoenzyme-A synthase n=1 Tax=Formimonas warabiya TaxID=1761012 RepID=A0A3G1L226_FORW1|nr:triphosphoribosyl-dephospho-CoA synthase CitG [Candidatus Formimonas warabiya]ATW28679.1 triphosphoribosyl-dephospho-CoA synthase CitG [Candidatus Formimonas warabiya]